MQDFLGQQKLSFIIFHWHTKDRFSKAHRKLCGPKSTFSGLQSVLLQVFEGLPRSSLHSQVFIILQSQKPLLEDILLKYSITSFWLKIKENCMSKISNFQLSVFKLKLKREDFNTRRLVQWSFYDASNHFDITSGSLLINPESQRHQIWEK